MTDSARSGAISFMTDKSTSQRNEVTGISNAEFFAKHAAPGRIGLAGGNLLIERVIRKAQRHLRADNSPSAWSHAFLFGSQREDGHRWILESDLEIHHRQIRLGVQENRVAKFHDEATYTNVAVLDFGLDAETTRQVMTAALDLLAGQSHYSLRELVGTLITLRRQGLRERDNLLARDGAFYCSAMVQHCYRAAGIDLAAGVTTKNVTPEDIAATPRPHTAWVLSRSPDLPVRKRLLARLKRSAQPLT